MIDSHQQPSRLVVVSARGPYRQRVTKHGLRWEKTVGGLVTAVLPVLQRLGGAWIAWGEPEGHHTNLPSGASFDLRYLELTPKQTDGFYYGFSNSALWPLCHYFLGRVHYDREQWAVYEEVNRMFAEAALEESKENDILWVHDYQLARVPEYIRRGRPTARLAFFWHIPFPAPEMFRTLPWRRPFLRGLLSSDLIGFHIPEYVDNLAQAAVELLAARVEGDYIRHEGHLTQVIARPIGIDVDEVERQARSERVEKRAAKLRETVGGQKVIIGVERMDYTKGILERLLGFERLLELKHELHGKVTLFQIVTPSRELVAAYQEKKREIDEVVGRINGRFSNDLWTPVHYLYRSFSPQRLMVYYRASDIALVTPLRDGLNLVAKEYVASHVDRDGVLVLSEFAGVSRQLPEAVVVNPYDVDDMARALEQALTMPKEEQQRRLEAMQRRIRAQDVSWWADEFLERMRSRQTVPANGTTGILR
ncbi:MAG: trehalose-6-phosphate synthase [Chloroflexi bacterium]|nr:trehalose-6-phosphate synthase [Chloroflexota bacterium]